MFRFRTKDKTARAPIWSTDEPIVFRTAAGVIATLDDGIVGDVDVNGPGTPVVLAPPASGQHPFWLKPMDHACQPVDVRHSKDSQLAEERYTTAEGTVTVFTVVDERPDGRTVVRYMRGDMGVSMQLGCRVSFDDGSEDPRWKLSPDGRVGTMTSEDGKARAVFATSLSSMDDSHHRELYTHRRLAEGEAFAMLWTGPGGPATEAEAAALVEEIRARTGAWEKLRRGPLFAVRWTVNAVREQRHWITWPVAAMWRHASGDGSRPPRLRRSRIAMASAAIGLVVTYAFSFFSETFSATTLGALLAAGTLLSMVWTSGIVGAKSIEETRPSRRVGRTPASRGAVSPGRS